MAGIPSPGIRGIRRLIGNSHALFLDTGTFAAQSTQVIQFRTANLTYFMQNDAFNVGAVQREQALNTNPIADLAYSKGSCSSIALAFDHITLKALDTLFITFNNSIVNSHIITSFKSGILFCSCKLF